MVDLVCCGHLDSDVPEPPADPDAPRRVERVFTHGELDAVLDACVTPREEALVRIGSESGLRSGEVRGLRWPDVDLQARRIRVRRSVWRTNVKATKTHRARRIAITPALADCLARLYELEVVERGRDASGHVFVGHNGVNPVCPHGRSRP